MENLGRFLLIIGAVTFFIGLVITFVGKLPYIGRLPGDIYIERENFVFYFPLMTSIILSIVLTIIFHLFRK